MSTSYSHVSRCLQIYDGRCFVSTMLQDLGLYVQLGHPPDESCGKPVYGPRDFMVLHTNGIHPVTVLFCECDNMRHAGTHVQQLLRRELYPATITDATTCATFRLLETFHLLTLQSKVTAYDFYLTLEKLTDRTGVNKRYVSLQAVCTLRIPANLFI